MAHSSRPSWRTGLLVAGLSVVATLLLAELGLALFDHPPRLTTDSRAVIEHDSLLGWRNVRGAESRHVSDEYQVSMQFNARGERGPLRPLEKRPGTTRILVLGDSFVEGYGVEQHQRFAEIAERLLNSQVPTRPTEVLALGTRGYSTDQQLLWLERNAARYAPDLVVLMFYSNDVWYNGQPRLVQWSKPYFRRGPDSLVLSNVPVPQPAGGVAKSSRFVALKRWLRTRSRSYDLAVRAIKRDPELRQLAMSMGLSAASDPASPAFGPTVPNEYWVHRRDEPPEVDAAWATTDSLVARMEAQAERAGAMFMVFLVPDREVFDPRRAAEAYALPPALIDLEAVPRRFAQMCGDLAIRCLDPRSEFRYAVDSVARRGRRLYYSLDVHWTPEGHAIAARVLADAIRQSHIAHRP